MHSAATLVTREKMMGGLHIGGGKLSKPKI